MPNRDGEDTRYDPKRRGDSWHPTVGGGVTPGSQYSSTAPGFTSIEATPYGWDAKHSRTTMVPRNQGIGRGPAFDEEIDRYAAGPFGSEHRAKVAAAALSRRDEDKLTQYRA